MNVQRVSIDDGSTAGDGIGARAASRMNAARMATERIAERYRKREQRAARNYSGLVWQERLSRVSAPRPFNERRGKSFV
jgi:hypothetical protein